MGLFSRLFKKLTVGQANARAWSTLTESEPMFTSWGGELYQQELTRAAIERFSMACSKLRPEVVGTAGGSVERFVHTQPNDMMTWPTLLKRTAAVYDSFGTAIVVPLFARDQQTVAGIWPMSLYDATIVEYAGEPWVRFELPTGERMACELSRTCVLTKLQIESDVFGEPNCIDRTMQLIHAQNEAEQSAIRNGAKVRFIGALNGMVREEEIKKKRERFVKDNLGPENDSGIMVYDQTFVDVRQVEPQSYTISDSEMERIEGNVFNYFGISKAIMQNDYTEDQWGAWYEGKIEPFAVSFGDGLTRMCFSTNQQRRGDRIMFSSNRLEYASNPSKRNMVRDMVDRGIFSLNEGREILQLPPIEGGDARVIRGEYVNAAAVSAFAGVDGGGRLPKNVYDGERDLGGNDKIYQDSDAHGTLDVEY